MRPDAPASRLAHGVSHFRRRGRTAWAYPFPRFPVPRSKALTVLFFLRMPREFRILAELTLAARWVLAVSPQALLPTAGDLADLPEPLLGPDYTRTWESIHSSYSRARAPAFGQRRQAAPEVPNCLALMSPDPVPSQAATSSKVCCR